MRPPLSPRQRQLLAFIERYIQERGFPPSYEEMRTALKVSSLNGIAEMIITLE
ncbi:LexA repressor [bacterium HR20]|nr:LexA repressor [bacterium HR20]